MAKHKHFVNACVRYLQENGTTETTASLLDKVTNSKGEPFTYKPNTNTLAQLLARDYRVRQVSGFSRRNRINGTANTSKLAEWGLK